MRALIIDDEQYVRLVLEHTLREEGCDVVVASDGKAGIAALQSETFDCVITDLRMPGIDGLNVLAWVTDHQPEVEVVMLTGHGDLKVAVEAMKQGAWDFLIKDTQRVGIDHGCSGIMRTSAPEGEQLAPD